jgi:tRNA A-37 threonylcarbamoyl transferase component Bud32
MKEHWWFGRAAEATLAGREAWSVVEWMHAGGDVLSTDRDAAVLRLDGPEQPLLVKWRVVLAEQRWRWWLRASRERCEARGLEHARARGIKIPAPLAVGERRDACGRLVASVLVRTYVEGFVNAAEALASPGGERFLAPLAQALRSWHDAGWRHGDCWPKNMLVAEDGSRVLPIGAPQAFVVHPGAHPDDDRLRDLARFAAGVGLSAQGRDPFAFLGDYLAAPVPLPRADFEAGIRARLERVLAKRAEDERTRPEREPHGPPRPVPLPPDPRPVPRGRSGGARPF